MANTEATFKRGEFDFLWFLAGPLALPTRYAPQAVLEKYPLSVSESTGFLWRYVLEREFAERGMGVVDPFSSDVADFLNLYGCKEGYRAAIAQCSGVVACLMPYHWDEIPRSELNLSIAIETFKHPFVAFTPEVPLSARERKTMKEVKRFLSIIPACMRVQSAIRGATRKGIKMPTTTRDIRERVPEQAMVQCPVCGKSYRSEIVLVEGRMKPKSECPSCGKKEITE